jgi:exonuclease VII small subunit
MFGLIDISYPVQWNPALRQFTGNKQAVDLLVINANHKLDFLTAERASITFGVKAEMDGIPNINLGSIAMNATGAADGILATLSKTASAQIGIILDEGTSAINSLLNDVPEQIFSQVWDSAIEPQLVGLTVPSIPSFTLIDDIIQQLDTASADLEEVTNTLQSYLLPSEQDWFFNIATEAMQNLEQTQSVIRQVDAKLAQAQNGIRSITSFSVSDLSPESVWSDTVEVLQGDGTVLNIKWEDLSEKAISEF